MEVRRAGRRDNSILLTDWASRISHTSQGRALFR
jgi:hypothetical protein